MLAFKPWHLLPNMYGQLMQLLNENYVSIPPWWYIKTEMNIRLNRRENMDLRPEQWLFFRFWTELSERHLGCRRDKLMTGDRVNLLLGQSIHIIHRKRPTPAVLLRVAYPSKWICHWSRPHQAAFCHALSMNTTSGQQGAPCLPVSHTPKTKPAFY